MQASTAAAAAATDVDATRAAERMAKNVGDISINSLHLMRHTVLHLEKSQPQQPVRREFL